MKKLLIRLKAVYRIIFRKYNHWAILNIDNENILKMLQGEKFECDVIYHGLQPYNMYCMIKQVSKSKDEIDMALDKALFEANAISRKENN